ncbi:MAG: T9SS type A sorting domain-containing protein [Bacteroidia bacterium]
MKKIFTLLSLLLVGIISANAQYYYIPHINAGSNPGGLNTDIEQPTATGWATIATTSASPTWSSVATLPFPFTFNGSSFTQLKASTSGVVTFSTAAVTVPPATSSALPSASIPDNSVCVWGLAASGANDKIWTKTFGTAPNRQFWVQYNSYSCPGSTGWTYWGVVFEETTNEIYVVDQRNYNAPLALSIGLQLDGSTAVMVAGSPTLGSNTTLGGNLDDATDNSYYEFLLGTLPPEEAELSSLSIPRYVLSPSNVNITGIITNWGGTNITSIDIKYEVGGNVYSDTKTGLNIPFGGQIAFTHIIPFNVANPTNYSIKVWSDLTNDANHSNDTLTTEVNGLAFTTTKRVVFEEATGTWCGWCPRGAVYMDSLAALHPSTAMLIAVHNGDPMVVAAYDAGMNTQISGYPSGLVDRKDNNVDPSTFIAEYNQRINDVGPCDVDVTATYNPANLLATITVDGHFATDLTGDYRFNAVITEDDVTGTTTAWDQHNYYSFQSQNIPLQGAGHNWQAEPQIVLAANMIYDHVGRALLGGWNGLAGSLPSNMTANNTYSHTFTYQIPVGYDLSQLRAIGWVQNNATGSIINSNFSQVVSGIDNLENSTFGIHVFPNPLTSGFGNVKLNVKKSASFDFKILDILGNVVRSNQSSLKPGEYVYPLNLENLANGVYTVRVTSGSDALTQKIILNK